MYPLPTPRAWPLNQWYVAGFAREVGEEMLARDYLDHSVVLFRDPEGKAHALAGICPHRMMPMELGRLESDRLVCGYHGLAFAFDGTGLGRADGGKAECSLTRYPLKEKSGLLWIWMGEPDLAESTPLPPQEEIGIGAEGWANQFVDYYALKARYVLLIDNLFDLSHLNFVHSSILGDEGIGLMEPKVINRTDRLVFGRTMENADTDRARRMWFPGMGEKMSSRMETELVSISLINAGGPFFDGPDCDAPLLGHMNFIHAVTPATAHSSHYWTIMTRDFRIEDEQLSMMMAAINGQVVAQDVAALEAIELKLSSGVDLPSEASMRSDLGGLQARSRIVRMIKDEVA